MKIRYLLLGTSLSFLPALSCAQCVETTNCETLGYTENSCNNRKGLKCPFGEKWLCAGDKDSVCAENGFKYSCTGTGYNGGAGAACGGKYTSCTCSSGYEWKNGVCQQKASDYSTCRLGTLFYSDETCSYDKLSNKELLGVVVYEKTATENGWVMTVKPIATGIAWGIYGTTTGITDKAASASCTNTNKLATLGNENEAARAANNYHAGNKKWCLPTYNVLNNINNQINLTKINIGITTAKGIILGNVDQSTDWADEYIWSSSEQDLYDAWYLWVDTIGNFGMALSHKHFYDETYSVRPVFAF